MVAAVMRKKNRWKEIGYNEDPETSGLYAYRGDPRKQLRYLPSPAEIAEKTAEIREDFRQELQRNKHQHPVDDYDRIGNVMEFDLSGLLCRKGNTFRDHAGEYELMDSEYWNQTPEQ